MIRQEIQWLADETANPAAFKNVRSPWAYGFEHRRTRLILWRDGDVWKRVKFLPWFFSAHIAVNDDEAKLLQEAGQRLIDNYHALCRQQKIDKGTVTLKQAFAQKNDDKKLIESKVEELPVDPDADD
jgi:hypothetical protein